MDTSKLTTVVMSQEIFDLIGRCYICICTEYKLTELCSIRSVVDDCVHEGSVTSKVAYIFDR